MKRFKYLIARRISQTAILFLFIAGNIYGWNLLLGNISSAKAFNSIPLSDPFAVLQITSTGTVPAEDAIIGAAIIFLFYAVIGGRLFCGWVCPVNLVTDAANWLRDLFRFELHGVHREMRSDIRYWFIGLSLLLSAIFGVAAFEWISPIGALHRGIVYGMGIGWMFIAAVFFFDLFAVKNGFCGHICPLGGFYALAGRYGFLRISYDREKCTLCMKCLEICPERQVLHLVGKQSGMVLSGECINCGRCIEVCNDNALKFGNIYSSRGDTPKRV